MPTNTTPEQLRLMFQNLLRERFQLADHREKRNILVYAITVASGGIRMQESPARKPVPGLLEDDINFEISRHNQSISLGPTGQHYEGDFTVTLLATNLTLVLDRPMADMTGLTQFFSVDFYWSWNPYAQPTPEPQVHAELPTVAIPKENYSLPPWKSG